MTLPSIIGITGQKFNGKDTIADYICEKYEYTKMSVADPLKEVCRTLFQFDDSQLYGKNKETIDNRWNITPRSAFQFVGTDLIRNKMSELIPSIGSNFWVKCLEEKIKKEREINPGVKIIIADIRFQNEIDLVKKFSDNLILKANRNTEINDSHSSENNVLTGIDFELDNNGTKNDLYLKIDNYFKQ